MSDRYPIHWIELHVIIPGEKRSRKTAFGICGKTRAIMAIRTSVLQMLVVNNLYVDDATQQCEEGSRCLNTECPLNRTTADTLYRALGMKRRPAWLNDPIKPIPIDNEIRQRIDALCDKYPYDGAVSIDQ